MCKAEYMAKYMGGVAVVDLDAVWPSGGEESYGRSGQMGGVWCSVGMKRMRRAAAFNFECFVGLAMIKCNGGQK